MLGRSGNTPSPRFCRPPKALERLVAAARARAERETHEFRFDEDDLDGRDALNQRVAAAGDHGVVVDSVTVSVLL